MFIILMSNVSHYKSPNVIPTLIFIIRQLLPVTVLSVHRKPLHKSFKSGGTCAQVKKLKKIISKRNKSLHCYTHPALTHKNLYARSSCKVNMEHIALEKSGS